MKCSKCSVTVTDSNHGCSDDSTKKALCAKCLNELAAPYLK